MRKNVNSLITSLSLCAALTLPVVSFAQKQKEQKEEKKEKIEHHHYKLVEIGTFGGPNSGLTGPNAQILNNRGMFAAFANTATPNPNASCSILFNPPDCFIERSTVGHNGTLIDLGVLPGGASLSPFLKGASVAELD